MPDQLTEARDQIAEMCGIVLIRKSHTESQPRHPRTWVIPDVRAWCEPDHPIPTCLNFVSRVWPEGVTWRREWEYYEETDDGEDYTGHFKWYATTRIGTDEKQNIVGLGDSNHELTDRMTLLLKVLVWLRDNDRPAFGAACAKIRKEIGK